MIKVKCVNNSGMESTLRLGETYVLVKETQKYYAIKMKYGTKGNFSKDRFEKL